MNNHSSCALVIFGVTGDLSRRKLLPSLYRLSRDGMLPPGQVIVGFGRRDWSHEHFREQTLAALNERVSYIREVAANAERCMPAESARSLGAIRDEYGALVATLGNGTSRISELERRVIFEVGKMVLR